MEAKKSEMEAQWNALWAVRSKLRIVGDHYIPMNVIETEVTSAFKGTAARPEKYPCIAQIAGLQSNAVLNELQVMLRDYPFDYLEKHLPLFCGLSSKCFEVLTKYTKKPILTTRTFR